MKRPPYIPIEIFCLIILSITSVNTIYCQENSQNTKQETIIGLPQGCRLVLDAKIDTTDTLSIEIIKGIRHIVSRVQSFIPLDSIAIDLAMSKKNVLPFLGLGGRTISSDNGITVEYYFDPENPNFKLELLINGLVHEFHHASRLHMPKWKLTLLELMVSEGLADHFMIEVTHCDQPQWSQALTEEEIKHYLNKAKPILNIKQKSWTKEFDEWLIFGRKGDDPIPGWTGYTLGWVIVENYLKDHPGATASSLVFTPAEEFVSSTPELVDSN